MKHEPRIFITKAVFSANLVLSPGLTLIALALAVWATFAPKTIERAENNFTARSQNRRLNRYLLMDGESGTAYREIKMEQRESRKNDPGLTPSWQGEEPASTRGRILDHADLRNVDVSGIDLISAVMVGANLREARLTGADLRRASLDGADLTDAMLASCKLDEAHMRRTRLVRTNLRWASLKGGNLSESVLLGADIEHGDLSNASLTRAAQVWK
jgi:uncharacterized protein YjbI with pentapeptide repeats